MSIDLSTLIARLVSIPPRCLKDAWPKGEQLPSDLSEPSGLIVSSWSVSVSPGSNPCMVIGEPTTIASDPPTHMLFDPLALAHDGTVIEIFNSVLHGFNNEIDVIDDKIVKPEPDLLLLSQRRPFECERCAAKFFSVVAKIYYQSGTIEMLMKHPDLPSSDMFNAINVYGICAACGQQNVIAEADGL